MSTPRDIAGYQPRIRAGFVHLPWLHEQIHDKPADTPSISLQVLSSAAERMIEAIIR